MSAAAMLGRPWVHARVLGSTNDRARKLGLAGAPHGTLVTADLQLAGRGRHGRRWSAPAGAAVLMSLVLRNGEEESAASAPITLAAAVAVADAVAAAADVLLKWPNDVIVMRAGRPAKLGGVLAERRRGEDFTVLGIGLNTSLRLDQLEPELRDRAASLGLPETARPEILRRLLKALAERLTAPAEQTLEAWRAREMLVGREIAWGAAEAGLHGGRGTAREVDGQGRLIVSLADGASTALDAGEVHLLEESQPSDAVG